jgi:hypothetical protein
MEDGGCHIDGGCVRTAVSRDKILTVAHCCCCSLQPAHLEGEGCPSAIRAAAAKEWSTTAAARSVLRALTASAPTATAPHAEMSSTVSAASAAVMSDVKRHVTQQRRFAAAVAPFITRQKVQQASSLSSKKGSLDLLGHSEGVTAYCMLSYVMGGGIDELCRLDCEHALLICTSPCMLALLLLLLLLRVSAWSSTWSQPGALQRTLQRAREL